MAGAPEFFAASAGRRGQLQLLAKFPRDACFAAGDLFPGAYPNFRKLAFARHFQPERRAFKSFGTGFHALRRSSGCRLLAETLQRVAPPGKLGIPGIFISTTPAGISTWRIQPGVSYLE